MARAFIGIGSNLNTPLQQVKVAIENLSLLPETECIRVSSLYASSPQGPDDQPDYVNAVALIETKLPAEVLLAELQNQESQQGKVKIRHWGERVIDLDILLYDDLQLQTSDLTIPHPHMHVRDFILLPLQEIEPEVIIPRHKKISQLIDELPERFVFPLGKN